MTANLYVATDSTGVQHAGGAAVRWHLPTADGAAEVTTAPEGSTLVLCSATALLDELGDRIYLAEPTAGATDVDADGVARVLAARLLAETSWSVERAAQFALDCAEHVLGDAAGAVLPGGATLGDVIVDARSVLERSSDAAETRLGTLARLWALHRLRRQGEKIGDLAFGTLAEDRVADLDALDDPAWATAATVRDAVLGAVEALRHVALPRHVAASEATYELAASTGDTPSTPSAPIVTPWGTITVGAEHRRSDEPAWIAARDTASRARDAARDRGGEDADRAELAFQAEQLERLLSSAGR
jgi:hypothetical protein